MTVTDPRPLIRFEYTNHRNETETRTVTPLAAMSYRTLLPWYPEPVWLFRAFDHDRNATREFQLTKMKNIRGVT